MFGLRVRSFDPSRCALRIEEQARSTRELKNDWTTRTVKLSEQACAILTAHIERYCANDPGAPMFPTMPGGRTEHNLSNFRNRVWAPAVERAGIGRRVRLYEHPSHECNARAQRRPAGRGRVSEAGS
jgi:integrase